MHYTESHLTSGKEEQLARAIHFMAFEECQYFGILQKLR